MTNPVLPNTPFLGQFRKIRCNCISWILLISCGNCQFSKNQIRIVNRNNIVVFLTFVFTFQLVLLLPNAVSLTNMNAQCSLIF